MQPITEWLHKSYISLNLVILSEHQGHPSWYKTVEVSHSLQVWNKSVHKCYRTMLNAYLIKSCQQSSLPWVLLAQCKFSVSFHKPTDCGSKMIFIQTMKFLRKWTQEYTISHTTVILNKSPGHPNWYQNIELSSVYHHAKFERNWSKNVWIHVNVTGVFLLTKSHTYGSFTWILNRHDKMSLKLIASTSLNSMPISTQTHKRLCEIIGTAVFANTVTLNQSQCQPD